MVLNQVSGQFNIAVYTWALDNLVRTPLLMVLKGNKWSQHVEKSTVCLQTDNNKVTQEFKFYNSKQFSLCKCNSWSKWSRNSHWSLSTRLAGFNTNMTMIPVSIIQHKGISQVISPTPPHPTAFCQVIRPPPKKKKLLEAIFIPQRKKSSYRLDTRNICLS